MPGTTSRVQQVIDRFVAELAQIAREEAAKIVLGGITPSARGAKSLSSGAHGEKRSPAKLAALQTKVLSFIKSHSGMRVEQINEGIGTETKDIVLPIKKLIAAKQIRAQGTRRATKYFAGGATTSKGSPRTKRRKRSKNTKR